MDCIDLRSTPPDRHVGGADVVLCIVPVFNSRLVGRWTRPCGLCRPTSHPSGPSCREADRALWIVPVFNGNQEQKDLWDHWDPEAQKGPPSFST